MADDIFGCGSRAKLLARKEDWARRDIEKCYEDCIAAVLKVSSDDYTKAASGMKVEGGDTHSLGDWLVAMGNDIEREILRRKMARLAKGKSDEN
tara:strand:+ start:364 stop:645 length:282 start_codon:yes stop_codon:yes gene_type:complete